MLLLWFVILRECAESLNVVYLFVVAVAVYQTPPSRPQKLTTQKLPPAYYSHRIKLTAIVCFDKQFQRNLVIKEDLWQVLFQ
jgi:hypothetical protein